MHGTANILHYGDHAKAKQFALFGVDVACETTLERREGDCIGWSSNLNCLRTADVVSTAKIGFSITDAKDLGVTLILC